MYLLETPRATRIRCGAAVGVIGESTMSKASLALNRNEVREREESLGGLLARAAHLISRGFDDQVNGHGLSNTEWRVLGALAQRDGVAMTELAEIVLFKQPTLTKAVDRMERAQLVQRRTPAEDRRRTLVYLTERGRRAAAPLVVRARQHDSAVNDALGETASRELKAALGVLIERLTQLPRERPRGRHSGRLAAAAQRG
jgi:MarR family transcriptional regulator, organic hydroperoxide resistance regulator